MYFRRSRRIGTFFPPKLTGFSWITHFLWSKYSYEWVTNIFLRIQCDKWGPACALIPRSEDKYSFEYFIIWKPPLPRGLFSLRYLEVQILGKNRGSVREFYVVIQHRKTRQLYHNITQLSSTVYYNSMISLNMADFWCSRWKFKPTNFFFFTFPVSLYK